MRSNALLKQDAFTFESIEATVIEINHVQIAREAEAASSLPGNHRSCDFEDFLAQYGMVSDFA